MGVTQVVTTSVGMTDIDIRAVSTIGSYHLTATLERNSLNFGYYLFLQYVSKTTGSPSSVFVPIYRASLQTTTLI
jgi:hypothetical protein